MKTNVLRIDTESQELDAIYIAPHYYDFLIQTGWKVNMVDKCCIMCGANPKSPPLDICNECYREIENEMD